jgi:hypothetical protein
MERANENIRLVHRLGSRRRGDGPGCERPDAGRATVPGRAAVSELHCPTERNADGADPAGVLQPAPLQTVQPVPEARPVVHHRIVASRTTIHHVAVIHSSRPLYDIAAPAVPPPAAVVAPAVVVPVIAAPAPGQVLNVSGQFQCIQGCAGGLPGLAFVTQNGWDLNLVNELGQPTRAWVDWPGHIWAQSWNEGAVYSPDGMTIQFDNGAVWQRSLQLLEPIPTYSR